jgi:hypothetical protein
MALIAGLVGALAVGVVPHAEARGFVGFSVGVPIGAVPVYPPPPVYYAYPPPPVVYSAPPPAAYAAPAPPSAAAQTCREYRGNAVIGDKTQTLIGTACLQPDGTWKIVQ